SARLLPPGAPGSANEAAPGFADEQQCREDRGPLPCATASAGYYGTVFVGVPPQPLGASVGRLLVRGGLVLLVVLLLASVLARSASHGRGVAAVAVTAGPADGAPPRAMPAPVARALAARRRVRRGRAATGTHLDQGDLLERVGGQLRAPLTEIAGHVELLQNS